MSDLSSPPASVPPPTDPTPPTAPPRRWDWRPKLQWFGAEYLIVVLGVLTAVAINAGWQSRQDADRERVYLAQLAEDLRETERIMADRDARMEAETHRAFRRLQLSFGQTPRPPRDSVAAWLYGIAYTATPRPVLGTAEALVASGDFGAVADDSLRAAILRYLDLSREYMADQEDYIDQRYAVTNALYEDYDRSALADALFGLREGHILSRFAPDADTTGRAASPDWQHPFPYDPLAVYDDPAFFRTLSLYGVVLEDLGVVRRVFRESAAALRQQVESHLDS